MSSFQSELVRVAIAIYLDLKPSEIRRNAHLKRDLGLEPLDVILIVFRLEELTDAEWDETFEVNFFAAMRACITRHRPASEM